MLPNDKRFCKYHPKNSVNHTCVYHRITLYIYRKKGVKIVQYWQISNVQKYNNIFDFNEIHISWLSQPYPPLLTHGLSSDIFDPHIGLHFDNISFFGYFHSNIGWSNLDLILATCNFQTYLFWILDDPSWTWSWRHFLSKYWTVPFGPNFGQIYFFWHY